MKVVLWFLMMLMPLMANASSVNEEQLFHRLDSYIAQRSKFTQRKEAKLLRLKKQLYTTSDKRSQLRLYNQIYREYYTYRYDSAMTYAKKGYQLAVQNQSCGSAVNRRFLQPGRRLNASNGCGENVT